ncbi:hypothetical protein B4134_3775 [Bacillus safensis]|nr:hypothetical protein B4134_3775 [Bacillus safensis]
MLAQMNKISFWKSKKGIYTMDFMIMNENITGIFGIKKF